LAVGAQGGRRRGGRARRCQFVPIGVVAGKAPHRPVLLASPEQVPTPVSLPTAATGGSIEITLPNGARVSVDAFVNEKALSRVLRAMKGLA
jgi:transposase